jgi:tetratricopeptide (TPR) repeat protein
MRRSYFHLLLAAGILFCSALVASAQTGELRGSVKMVAADGSQTPVANAIIDVFRTDMAGEFHTKSDKKGEWVFAGLPYIGEYVVAVSAPGASPSAKSKVKAGRDIPVDLVVVSGNGKKFTREEAISSADSGPATSSGGDSAAEKAKAAEIAKKNEEINKENEKITNANQVVGEAFKNGNAALMAKNYDEAIKQYDAGLAADPEHPGASSLLTNKSAALRSRAVEKYNAAIQNKDEAAKNAGLETAKADFKAAAEAANQAVTLVNKQPAATDPNEQKQQTTNKYFALSARAEAMRLFVSKVDPTKVDDASVAFQEYIAAEPDAAKKTAAQQNYAKMLLDIGAGDKAYAEYQKILAQNPDDPDANRGAGLALFSTGDKSKYQEAANYLQKFVNNAPDSHPEKQSAKEALEYLKTSENVVPEKTSSPPPRKKRP